MGDYALPIGEPPSIQWLPTCALMVDHTYQRLTSIPASRRIIASIASSWDWRLCAPLTVSHRPDDGTTDSPGYYIIDGQHRFEAAEERGDILELPCLVSQFASIEDEARCFVTINAVRRMPSRLDSLHAGCAANDAGAVAIREIVEDAGLRIARTPGWQTWKPGEVAFIGAIASAVKSYGRPYASAALVNIAEAFGDAVLMRGKPLFEGLVLVHAKTVGPLDADELLETLKLRNQFGWYSDATQRRAAGAANEAEAMRLAILDAYAKFTSTDLNRLTA